MELIHEKKSPKIWRYRPFKNPKERGLDSTLPELLYENPHIYTYKISVLKLCLEVLSFSFFLVHTCAFTIGISPSINQLKIKPSI